MWDKDMDIEDTFPVNYSVIVFRDYHVSMALQEAYTAKTIECL
jgi:hypothetical protein